MKCLEEEKHILPQSKHFATGLKTHQQTLRAQFENAQISEQTYTVHVYCDGAEQKSAATFKWCNDVALRFLSMLAGIEKLRVSYLGVVATSNEEDPAEHFSPAMFFNSVCPARPLVMERCLINRMSARFLQDLFQTPRWRCSAKAAIRWGLSLLLQLLFQNKSLLQPWKPPYMQLCAEFPGRI